MKSTCDEASWRPFRAPLFLGPVFQGLRSFHSLTPGYSPCTPPACETAVSKRPPSFAPSGEDEPSSPTVQFKISNLQSPMQDFPFSNPPSRPFLDHQMSRCYLCLD